MLVLRSKHMLMRSLILSFLLYNAPIQPIAPLYIKGIMTAIASIGVITTFFKNWLNAMFWGYKLEQEAQKEGISIPLTPLQMIYCLGPFKEVLEELKLQDPVAVFKAFLPLIKRTEIHLKAKTHDPVESLKQLLVLIRQAKNSTQEITYLINEHIIALEHLHTKNRVMALEGIPEKERTVEEDHELLLHYENLALYAQQTAKNPELPQQVEKAQEQQAQAALFVMEQAKKFTASAQTFIASLPATIEQLQQKYGLPSSQPMAPTKPEQLVLSVLDQISNALNLNALDLRSEQQKKVAAQTRATQELIRAAQTTPISLKSVQAIPVTVAIQKTLITEAESSEHTLTHLPAYIDVERLKPLDPKQAITEEEKTRAAQRSNYLQILTSAKHIKDIAARTARLQQTLLAVQRCSTESERKELMAVHNRARALAAPVQKSFTSTLPIIPEHKTSAPPANDTRVAVTTQT